MTTIDISLENLYNDWKPDESYVVDKTRLILEYYLQNLDSKSCLSGETYDILSIDLVFCDSKKTHELNKEYRFKDAPADIITFALFADDSEHFVLGGNINLGEIIIALDKVEEGVNRDISHSKNREQELFFLISHGLMHLLGFDHQSESEYNFVIEEQRKALKSIEYDKI